MPSDNNKPAYWHETQHSMSRRNKNLSYHGGGIAYMITQKIEEGAKLLSTLPTWDEVLSATNSRIEEEQRATAPVVQGQRAASLDVFSATGRRIEAKRTKKQDTAMIYYFSGTGNSKMIAERLALLLDMPVKKMTEELKEDTKPSVDGDVECIGLVFPVYAWGLPKVVEEFVSSNAFPLRLCYESGKAERQKRAKVQPLDKSTPPYVFTVMTCGDDMGYADEVLETLMKERWGVGLSAAFSVQMPNTYVNLPGFDIDPKELAEKKVRETMERLPAITDAIRERRMVREVTRGGMPWVKTYLLRQPFNKWLLTDKYFKVDTEKCISCGKCEKACPVGNIAFDFKPQWQGKCVGCMGCYHTCPMHAIDFGRFTKTKGQKQ